MHLSSCMYAFVASMPLTIFAAATATREKNFDKKKKKKANSMQLVVRNKIFKRKILPRIRVDCIRIVSVQESGND